MITDVEVLAEFRLRLTFDDGRSGVVDLSRIVGRGVFTPLRDADIFATVRVGPSGGLSWANDFDLCPDALYMEATGTTPEEVFPPLKTEQTRA